MTREEFKTIVKEIRMKYPNCPITTQEIFDSWYRDLKDICFQDALESLYKHVLSSKFSPTIAELRNTAQSKNRFVNFIPRGYDMTSLELALLDTDRRQRHEKAK